MREAVQLFETRSDEGGPPLNTEMILDVPRLADLSQEDRIEFLRLESERVHRTTRNLTKPMYLIEIGPNGISFSDLTQSRAHEKFGRPK